MTLRRTLLSLVLLGATVAPASAQFIIPIRLGGMYGGPWGGFGGYGYPYGGFGYPYGGYRYGVNSYPYRGTVGGYFSYVTPTYVTYPTTYTVGTRAMAPYGSPLAHDPRYQNWAGAYGYNLRHGMAVPHARESLYPAVPVDSTDRPEQRVAQATFNDPRRAQIELIVPNANAQVWLDGVPMNQSGTVRHFITPPLESGSDYTFEVRVTYPGGDGEARTVRRTVDVRAGQQYRLDLTTQ